MLGSNTGTPKIYLTVGFGKIRQKSLENKTKVDANTPGAVKRLTKAGAESWAMEYDFIGGIIEGIFYKEDKEYGNSFEVTLSDGPDVYQLSFSEDSLFWTAFMERLPNIVLDRPIVIHVYDFEDKDRKRRAGLNVEQDNNANTTKKEKKSSEVVYNVNSAYREWVGVAPNGSMVFKNGFPSSKGVNFEDKEDQKIYFLQVKKFLRDQFKKMVFNKPAQSSSASSSSPGAAYDIPSDNFVGAEGDGSDDLPF